MIAGIHQLNYFPWMGYFNKIAKSDVFILLDEVQLTDSETMQRNRVLGRDGQPVYLSVAFDKRHYMQKRFCDLTLNAQVDWQRRQANVLYELFHKLPHWDEAYALVAPVFERPYERLIDVNRMALDIVLDMLGLRTRLVYQSALDYDRAAAKNELVLALCRAVQADGYLSGSGARKYMDLAPFEAAGVSVCFQTFTPPAYAQAHAAAFVPGLSILDVLFNCGVEQTKTLFRDSLQKDEGFFQE